MSMSYDTGLLRNGTSWTSAVGEWRNRLPGCVAAGGGQFKHKMWTFVISDFFLYRNFQIQLFDNWNTAVSFSINWLFCWIQCVLCASFCKCNYITQYERISIKYATANHKFPNEYIDVIFIQIDQHFKMLLKKYKGVPILWNTV